LHVNNFRNKKSIRAPGMHRTKSIKINKLPLMKEKVKGAEYSTTTFILRSEDKSGHE